MGFLEESAADLLAGDVRSDGKDRRPSAVRVVESVDQMEVARATRAGTDSKLPSKLRLGRCGKSGGLLVADMNPVDAAFGRTSRLTDSVHYWIQTVSDDSINPLHAGSLELFDELGSKFLGHSVQTPAIVVVG